MNRCGIHKKLRNLSCETDDFWMSADCYIRYMYMYDPYCTSVVMSSVYVHTRCHQFMCTSVVMSSVSVHIRCDVVSLCAHQM